MESYVDFETKKATIVIYRNIVSNNVMKYLKEMTDKIMNNYKIENIKIYTHNAFHNLLDSGKIEFPTSSIIQPKLENNENILPQTMINGIPDIYANDETLSSANIV